MSVALKAHPTTWRRSLRFGSLALNVLVPVAGAWLGWIIGSAHAQNTAIAAVEGVGGAILYSHKSPWLNKLMIRLFATDYPRTVSHVYLRENACDADLIHLRSFDRLKFLSLERSNVDDFGLEHLEGLTSIEHLILTGTKITDAGLTRLRTLKKLSVLDLADTRVTDAGLVHLKGFKNLSKLDLRGTRASAVGMQDLEQALPELAILRGH
jgi:hypothetical protein